MIDSLKNECLGHIVNFKVTVTKIEYFPDANLSYGWIDLYETSMLTFEALIRNILSSVFVEKLRIKFLRQMSEENRRRL